MTTSPETNDLNHPALRRLVSEAESLSLPERVTLLKGLIPLVARELSPIELEALIVELRMKGQRFQEATLHPGQGRAHRHVMGERDLEGR
ncbi:MAG TPA: hypothetical protein VHM30_11635 [Gemmatimonadaceae bacterium]|nr:hypothetical protein [Gemmatimonadaceae bacterium]